MKQKWMKVLTLAMILLLVVSCSKDEESSITDSSVISSGETSQVKDESKGESSSENHEKEDSSTIQSDSKNDSSGVNSEISSNSGNNNSVILCSKSGLIILAITIARAILSSFSIAILIASLIPPPTRKKAIALVYLC